MKLARYMQCRRLTDSAFGEMIGVSESQISRLRRGISWPERKTAEAIMKATDGEVMPEDFLEGVTSVKMERRTG